MRIYFRNLNEIYKASYAFQINRNKTCSSEISVVGWKCYWYVANGGDKFPGMDIDQVRKSSYYEQNILI